MAPVVFRNSLLGRNLRSAPTRLAEPTVDASVTPGFMGLPENRGLDQGRPRRDMTGAALASLTGGLEASGLPWRLVSAEVDAVGRSSQPIPDDSALTHEIVVVRIRVRSGGGSRISALWRLRTDVPDSESVLNGRLTFDSPLGDEATSARFQFCTAAWGSLLVPILQEDAGFVSAVAAYDGTIGLAASSAGAGGAADEVHFRLYRGRVIEVARRSIRGADFVLQAEDETWSELILGERNDFMRRAMTGQFRSSGSGYEYLRMTKVLVAIIDAARVVARLEERK